MSVAEKARPTKVTVEVPRSLLPELKKRYGVSVKELEEDEGSISIDESAWYKGAVAGQAPKNALRVYRENRGFSQAELAKKLGSRVTRQHVADMEAGRRGISKDTAKKLSVILKAPVVRFL